MAQLRSIPQTTFPAGPFTVGPDNVAGSIKQYAITLDISLFPFTGGTAFTYSCESSQDNGQTWTPETSGDVLDAPIPAKFGNPANRLAIVCPIRGTGGRRVRANLVFAKSVTLSGTIAAN
jgi:hypothetical protein